MSQLPDVPLTTAEAAKIAGVVPATIRLWENSGRLHAIRTTSGQRLFTRADLERAITERRDAGRGHGA
jgi:excisionase family DNA binding protein